MTPIHGIKETVSRTITKLLSGPVRPGQTFTMPGTNYDRIYRNARRLKAYFDDHAQPGVPVCLFSDDRATLASALLASLAGGPALLLPHALSETALGELKRLTDFSVAIGSVSEPQLPGVTVIDGDNLEAEVESLTSETALTLERIWVYLFTGGSTGKPRLWAKTPVNLLGEADYLVHRFVVGIGDRILATVSPLHVYGLLYSLLVPLLATARVVADTPSFPEEIKHEMAEASPTIFVSVPAHYRAIGVKPPEKGALRLAFSSAGPLPEVDGHAFSREMQVDLVEIYGSTETGGIATRCRVKGETGFIPYDCIQWRVAGEELDIRSAFLSRELPIRESGWFTVSDRVKAHGNEGFLVAGRADQVVKVGGNRVDLDRVRQVLCKIKGVSEALVRANPVKGPRENEIVALVVGDTTESRLKESLDDVLEPHERPRRIHMTDRIPTTAMGKIDGRAIEKLMAKQ